jgi:hypothetical protein
VQQQLCWAVLPATARPACLPGALPARLPCSLQGFDTSQGKKHADAGAIKTKTTRGARQYMNRKASRLRVLPAACACRVLCFVCRRTVRHRRPAAAVSSRQQKQTFLHM